MLLIRLTALKKRTFFPLLIRVVLSAMGIGLLPVPIPTTSTRFWASAVNLSKQKGTVVKRLEIADVAGELPLMFDNHVLT